MAWGASSLNRSIWKRERESAMSFLLPSMCSALIQKLDPRVRRVNWRTRSMTLGIRDLFGLTVLTTDSLSQKNWMCLFEKKLAHRWQATTKANNSCHAIEILADLVFDGVPMSPETSGFEKCPQIPENQRHLCTETRHLKWPNEIA